MSSKTNRRKTKPEKPRLSKKAIRRKQARRRRVLFLAATVLVPVPVLAFLFLSTSLCEVQRISIHGVRYGSPEDLMVEAGIEEGVNIFSDLTSFEESLREQPLVREAHFERRPPHSILISVEEREPFAILAMKRTVPVTRDGVLIPREQIAVDLDLPLLTLTGLDGEGTAVFEDRMREGLALLAAMERDTPELEAQVSELVVDDQGPSVLYLRSPRARVVLGKEWNPVVSGLLSGVVGCLEPTAGVYEIDLRFARQAVVRERGGGEERPVYGAI
jgi:hypothetical protein